MARRFGFAPLVVALLALACGGTPVIVLGHLIVRSSGAWQLQRSPLASPALLRQLLAASAAAIGIILAVDLVTGGDLFLRPRSPQSEILIGLVLVGLAGGRSAVAAFGALARRRRG